MKPQDDTPVPHPNQDMDREPIAPGRSKRVVSVSQLKHTPPHTADDIRRLMREGRFAEMKPGQAGDD